MSKFNTFKSTMSKAAKATGSAIVNTDLADIGATTVKGIKGTKNGVVKGADFLTSTIENKIEAHKEIKATKRGAKMMKPVFEAMAVNAHNIVVC